MYPVYTAWYYRTMSKTHVLLMYGGESPEHEISIRSAHNVYAALDDVKFDVTLCYVDKTGRFWLVPSMDSSHIGQPQLLPEPGHRQFLTLPDLQPVRPDVVFPVLHGKNGEDGTVQGMLDLLHIPYVGPSVLGAAITMEKDTTKRLVQQAGLTTAPWHVWRTTEPKPSYHHVSAELGPLLFVKPSRAGSSVGVTKVHDEKEFFSALETAARFDSVVLIETAISGREIEVAVLGNETPSASRPGEIVPGAEFYSYDDKYSAASEAQVQAPADLDDETARRIQREALVAYRATAGQGMARVDFLLDEQGVIYLSEINAIPGFTSISMYPRAFHASGMSYSTLIEKLITLALEKK